MTTGFGLIKIQWHPQIAWFRKKTLLGARFRALCVILAELWLTFCAKIPKFSLPWQQGLSDVYFNDTIKLLDLENPLFGAKFVALSLVFAEFQPIFCQKFPNFRYHGNRGRSEKNFDDAVKLPDPENPHFGANILLLSLKMPELLPFEVAVMQIFKFFVGGREDKCENSSSRPRCYIKITFYM